MLVVEREMESLIHDMVKLMVVEVEKCGESY
jgi:hypothetical protein